MQEIHWRPISTGARAYTATPSVVVATLEKWQGTASPWTFDRADLPVLRALRAATGDELWDVLARAIDQHTRIISVHVEN